ncbi:FG-GAP repeat domain-containing protein [Puniceicoccus vermicola]|uniref:VCBS repeat-containing protein n=1 Tax=Puniceicoccus vermicola TaxID=388746 RepID=A0A7X1AWB0_9BACT|nr:VCBS repeat-containing protein [Puniceicoccus vermicola]MBC2601178.1 VCBS repeat-containing protein [Puniceicoccus vermicola]
MSPRLVVTAVGLGLAGLTLWGGDSPELSGFGPPIVTKLDWDTRSLQVGDINGDGEKDLFLVNNDRGRIDFLLRQTEGEAPPPMGRTVRKNRWEPELEDAFFREENLSTGFPVFAVVGGDFNGDGLVDFAYTGREEPLSIRYQREEGGFEDAVTYDQFSSRPWTSTVKAGDIDGDGRTDLIVLGEEDILLFHQGEEGLADSPDKLRLTADTAYGIDLADINGDGRPDIFYTAGSGARAWRVRLQEESGAFGPEQAFDLKIGSAYVYALRSENLEEPTFAYIAQNSGAINLFAMRERSAESAGFEEARPRIYPVSSGDAPAAYAYGDFDGDGLGELAVADPEESSILLYRQEGGWNFQSPQSFPSLLGISELIAVPREGGKGDDLAVFSSQENFAGLSRMTEEGRFAFPVPFPVEGEIQTLAYGRFAEGGPPQLIGVTKNGRDYNLVVLERGGDHPSGFRLVREESVPNVKRSPGGLVVFDLNDDGQKEILLLAPREAARIFRLAPENEEEADEDEKDVSKESALVEIAGESSVRKSLLNGLDRNQLGYGDVDWDGKDELIVAAQGFARAVGLDADDRFVILDQFNARSSGDVVRIPVLVDVDGDGESELLFYDSEAGVMQRLQRDEKGVLRYRDSADVGWLEARGVLVNQDDSGSSLLVLGSDRFWVLPLLAGEWETVPVSSYETDLLDVSPTELVFSSSETGPPFPVVSVDGQEHVIELLDWSPPDEWASRLHFTVFEQNLHYRGRVGAPEEPREALLDDLTGDGIPDLVILVHDRILIYPGE